VFVLRVGASERCIFGNNVEMMKGQTYMVEVKEAHLRAVFHVTPG
jgi:hypothetical protein